jgi:hypothetical protein
MGLILPDEIGARIPSLHAQDGLPDAQLQAYARLTFPDGRITWFVLEIDQDQRDTFAAYMVEPHTEQFGYFAFGYLDEIMPVGRLAFDVAFAPTLLIDAVLTERSLRRSAFGEPTPTDRRLAEHRAYYLAAEFSPKDAREAHEAIEHIIFSTDEELNVSAFVVNPGTVATLVVIGDRPPDMIHHRIMDAFGERPLTIIDYDVLMHLFRRKLEQNQRGTKRASHRHIVLQHKRKQR